MPYTQQPQYPQYTLAQPVYQAQPPPKKQENPGTTIQPQPMVVDSTIMTTTSSSTTTSMIVTWISIALLIVIVIILLFVLIRRARRLKQIETAIAISDYQATKDNTYDSFCDDLYDYAPNDVNQTYQKLKKSSPYEAQVNCNTYTGEFLRSVKRK